MTGTSSSLSYDKRGKDGVNNEIYDGLIYQYGEASVCASAMVSGGPFRQGGSSLARKHFMC